MNRLKNTIKQHELIPVMIWTAIFVITFLIPLVFVRRDMGNGSVLRMFVSFLVTISVFYLHTYILYPLKEKPYGKWYYTIFLILCLVCYSLIQNYFMPDVPPMEPHNGVPFKGSPPPRSLFNLFSFVFVIFISYCYRLYIDKVRQSNLLKEKEAIHVKTELDFLRSQISPHFIFNLMNTLVLMARKKSELMEPSLITLSQLMRYMLYDSGDGQISLENEIKYLKNYINLQLLGFGDNSRFNLSLSGNFEGFWIEPMLLIPFVENAFKHGTAMVQEPVIDVAVTLDNNKRNLSLMIMNSTNRNNRLSEKPSGIGLANVKRRLELLYPDKHQIQVEQQDDEFRVNLEISL